MYRIVKLFASTTADEGMFSARLNDVAPMEAQPK